MKKGKKILFLGLLALLPSMVFAQAVCTRYHVNVGFGEFWWTDCNNPESNTSWFVMYF